MKKKTLMTFSRVEVNEIVTENNNSSVTQRSLIWKIVNDFLPKYTPNFDNSQSSIIIKSMFEKNDTPETHPENPLQTNLALLFKGTDLMNTHYIDKIYADERVSQELYVLSTQSEADKMKTRKQYISLCEIQRSALFNSMHLILFMFY